MFLIDQTSVHIPLLFRKAQRQVDPMQLVLPTHDRTSNRAGAALTDIIAVKAVMTARKEKRMFGIGIDAKVS